MYSMSVRSKIIIKVPSKKFLLLKSILNNNFDFDTDYKSRRIHNIHSFSAKFPPQLPSYFISRMTKPGDIVLDPMMGSGTTIVESSMLGRAAIGYDIDDLANRICKVKTTPIKRLCLVPPLLQKIADRAEFLKETDTVTDFIGLHFDDKSKEFLDYWFYESTQRELAALMIAMNEVTEQLNKSDRSVIKNFLELNFSSIIITKSGGVSRAIDLAHSRPHLVKNKKPKNAIKQFIIRSRKNLRSLDELGKKIKTPVSIRIGDARNLKLQQPDESVDLIVTSPPYANAIDYMRAHKFSLVWFGKKIEELGEKRGTYIGSERIGNLEDIASLPDFVEDVITQIRLRDKKKAKVFRKYLIEMKKVLEEMYRVLKADSSIILVVGPSTMRGYQVDTHKCLAQIAINLENPLLLAGIKQRNISRNRRMMPARFGGVVGSNIEKRMHVEHIIGLHKCGREEK